MKFYSEMTKKLYESEEELKTAEKEVADAEAKKAEASKAKKEDALKVEEAFKANNAARREYNKNVTEAKKIYTEGLKSLRSSFDAAVATETKKLDEAEKAYDAALKDFIAKYPEGYHLTLTDSDNVVTLSNNAIYTSFDFFDKLFDMMKI